MSPPVTGLAPARPPRPTGPSRRIGAEDTSAAVELPGGRLEYVLRRSPRSRRMRVTVDPRRGVVVTVPTARRSGWRHAETAVEAFLAERERWIRRHVGRMDEERLRVPAAAVLADGVMLRFLGEPHRLRILASRASGASTISREGGADVDEIVVRLARGERRPLDALLQGWLRERAARAIEQAIDRHAPSLGVRPAVVALRDPRTRWGSATREGRLMFSWRLVLAPPEALETVVVHELAHLQVFGHGDAFWELVATRRPDHREWRRWLRLHSVELHAALAR